MKILSKIPYLPNISQVLTRQDVMRMEDII